MKLRLVLTMSVILTLMLSTLTLNAQEDDSSCQTANTMGIELTNRVTVSEQVSIIQIQMVDDALVVTSNGVTVASLAYSQLPFTALQNRDVMDLLEVEQVLDLMSDFAEDVDTPYVDPCGRLDLTSGVIVSTRQLPDEVVTSVVIQMNLGARIISLREFPYMNTGTIATMPLGDAMFLVADDPVFAEGMVTIEQMLKLMETDFANEMEEYFAMRVEQAGTNMHVPPSTAIQPISLIRAEPGQVYILTPANVGESGEITINGEIALEFHNDTWNVVIEDEWVAFPIRQDGCNCMILSFGSGGQIPVTLMTGGLNIDRDDGTHVRGVIDEFIYDE